MKKFNGLFIVIMILMISCSKNEEVIETEQQESLTRSLITYSGDADGVSVLIFHEDNSSYSYKDIITGGWTNNRTSRNLTLGKYKFLYYKSAGLSTNMSPGTFSATTKFEDVKIVARADSERPGYILPVDEIWLPATEEMADSVYTITGNDTIKNTLKRAVTQIELHLKRATSDDEPFAPFPYPPGQNIMRDIEEVTLDISGVGESINYIGSEGNGKTFYHLTSAEISDQGFAHFVGPFVFPSAQTGANSTVNIKLIPKTGSVLDGLNLSTVITGKLEKNKKLSITVWLTSTYNIIDVDVDTSAIALENDGDKGIWE